MSAAKYVDLHVHIQAKWTDVYLDIYVHVIQYLQYIVHTYIYIYIDRHSFIVAHTYLKQHVYLYVYTNVDTYLDRSSETRQYNLIRGIYLYVYVTRISRHIQFSDHAYRCF